jgi:hypothetical protein
MDSNEDKGATLYKFYSIKRHQPSGIGRDRQ